MTPEQRAHELRASLRLALPSFFTECQTHLESIIPELAAGPEHACHPDAAIAEAIRKTWECRANRYYSERA